VDPNQKKMSSDPQHCCRALLINITVFSIQAKCKLKASCRDIMHYQHTQSITAFTLTYVQISEAGYCDVKDYFLVIMHHFKTPSTRPINLSVTAPV
jgi:hypothetical protein